MSNETCYMCHRLATSDEHVPPKVLFPELKDTGGVDYRKDLIKVPSCYLHNNSKSKDDEYLFITLIQAYGSNQIAQDLFSTKGMRALTRNRDLILKLQYNYKDIVYKGNETAMGYVQHKRIISSVDKIARGIYFHHYNSKLLKPLYKKYFFGFFNPSNPQFLGLMQKQERLYKSIDHLFRNSRKFGENQDVFYYQIGKFSFDESVVIRFVVYSGLHFLASHNTKVMHRVALLKKLNDF